MPLWALVPMARKQQAKKTQWPEAGGLEQNVDGVLRAHGLQLDATPDKLIEKSRRRARHAFPRPARAKRLA